MKINLPAFASGYEHRPLHRDMPLVLIQNAKVSETSRCIYCDVGCVDNRDSPVHSRDDLYGQTRSEAELFLRVSSRVKQYTSNFLLLVTSCELELETTRLFCRART